MTSINNKFTLLLCISGLALLAVCEAAELPTAPSTPTTAPAKDDQLKAPNSQEDKDGKGDGWFGLLSGNDGDESENSGDEVEGDYEEDYYDDDYEEGEEEEMTPEDELAELSEDHRYVKRDCLELREMVSEAKSGSEPVDPELQEEYEGCESELKRIETRMRELTSQITEAPSQ